jgi:hypothetical protein
MAKRLIIQNYSLVENGTGSHQIMPGLDGVTAFKFLSGEHSKTRLNVFEARMCTNIGNLGFAYRCFCLHLMFLMQEISVRPEIESGGQW